MEKDINLSISLLLKDMLAEEGYQVVLTRDEDEALYAEGDANKKRSDMNQRVRKINNSKARISVSIHQNSFSDPSSSGAQVFYYHQSEEGKKLAEVLQAVIKQEIADENHRETKANDNYFMLKYSQCPLVIVECGFLSNYAEAERLQSAEYQQQMAKAICKGIVQYLQQGQPQSSPSPAVSGVVQ